MANHPHSKISASTCERWWNNTFAAAVDVNEFLLSSNRRAWMPKLAELLADQGKLRAGPFSLFFGAIYQDILYLDESILNNPTELALTILHELGASQGLTHLDNLDLEKEYIQQTANKPVKLTLYSTGVKIEFGTSGWRGKIGQDFVYSNMSPVTMFPTRSSK